MFSIESTHARPAARNRAAALALAALAAGYSLLSVYYFYADFFQYLDSDAVMSADRSGWQVAVVGGYLWTILSPWRIAGAALAVALLGVSAEALWHGRPRSRALALLTVWGVLFPQVLWYTEFLVDWNQGQGVGEAVMLAITIAAIPTILVRIPGRPLADWSAARPDRLLGLAIVCAWMGFAATEFLDHSYLLLSWTAYAGALVAIPLAALAVRGIFRMRAWSILAGLGAAAALALVPLAASWTSYVGTGGYFIDGSYVAASGYIDSLYRTLASSDWRIGATMAAPLLAIYVLSAPFVHAAARTLRRR